MIDRILLNLIVNIQKRPQTPSPADDGKVSNVFHVSRPGGGKLDEAGCADVRTQIETFTANSSQSSRPAIYGVVAAAEVQRLKPLSASSTTQVRLTLDLKLSRSPPPARRHRLVRVRVRHCFLPAPGR